MRTPVVQQEWHRRQTQRPVWALLGVLAVVTAATTATTPVLPPQRSVATWEQRPTRAESVTDETTHRPGSGAVSARYWQGLARAADVHVRLRLLYPAGPRPVEDWSARYTRLFIRPPTTS